MRYYGPDTPTRLSARKKREIGEQKLHGQGGYREETRYRTDALEKGNYFSGTAERRRPDIFTKFLNESDYAKSKLGAKNVGPEGEVPSLLGMVEARVVDRLERAGVFELAMGVNVRQNAIKHLKKRG